MPYLNVEEVESALRVATRPPNSRFIKLIKLPHSTWEKRKCHAVKIAHGGDLKYKGIHDKGSKRKGIYFIGGVHAREWGSPDILINFIRVLARAYRQRTGITVGGNNFTATQIHDIVNSLDIFIFPQVNPDGRHHSMTEEPLWRKNRRPAPSTHPNFMGVDINRNYDFLWDYKKHFHPQAPVINSMHPRGSCYIGPSAVSEPETKNVVWMMERYPNICFFIDLHSYSEKILHNWGDDQYQVTDPSMNFRNLSYDGLRGIKDDDYREYIPACDKEIVEELEMRMQKAIQAVRGRLYQVQQSFDLYATAGTSSDYTSSRHFADQGKNKVYSFTLEWGRAFYPPYDEMKEIIKEITAGLLAFCVGAMEVPL